HPPRAGSDNAGLYPPWPEKRRADGRSFRRDHNRMNVRQEHTRMIREEALRLGFMFCGIAEAAFLDEEAPRLEKWLREGSHGSMPYMENYFDKRLGPRLLVPGARSVISLGLNYYTSRQQTDRGAPKISRYAYGKDYHFVIKDKLKEL